MVSIKHGKMPEPQRVCMKGKKKKRDDFRSRF